MYKRQAVTGARVIFTFFINKPPIITKKENAWIISVSYTHLDVYKRQVKALKKCYIVLAKPDYDVNTGYAYSQFDE